MKPPKCKVCGEPHWGHEPHIFKTKQQRPSVTVKVKAKPRAGVAKRKRA